MALLHPNLLPTFNSNTLTFPSIKLKPSLSHVPSPTPTRFSLSVSAAETTAFAAPPTPQPEVLLFSHFSTLLFSFFQFLSLNCCDYQKLGVVVKPTEKPRLVLKFIWMEKNIGIALDQMVPGHGTIPLSPYYFWPRKDAWEELKELLENKPWISQKQMIILLNQATDIINLWQQSGGNLS